MGAMVSMLWWDDVFCARLAERGLFVVRFDNRDVGRSSGGPPGELGYGVDDLVCDAIGVLDSYGVARAHFAGMSLGGMLSQVAALRFPDRVLSITAIASGVWDDRPELPGIDSSVTAYHARAASVDWDDETSVCEYFVGGWRLLCGTRHPFDESRARELARAEFRRARSLPSMFNHATLAGAEELYGRVPEIRVPVLVIHGTKDPVLPYPHARALAAAAPVSKLVTLEDAGHELHSLDWPLVIDEVEAHVRGAGSAASSFPGGKGQPERKPAKPVKSRRDLRGGQFEQVWYSVRREIPCFDVPFVLPPPSPL
jgi:pimeloyl-ACP methyl ester carboxylesterase